MSSRTSHARASAPPWRSLSLCGLVFASGFDLTRFGFAQVAHRAAKPTRRR